MTSIVLTLILMTTNPLHVGQVAEYYFSLHEDQLQMKFVIEKDELFDEAVNIIKTEGKASTSFLQRKLQIGYNRAARIMETMEKDGIVGQANHVGKREIL